MRLPSYDRSRLVELADALAVLLAVSLPWSTSATGILAVLWLLAFLPTCDFARLRRIAASPAGGIPIALVVLGAAGMLWADVAWADRSNGMSSFLKLLYLPLLMCHFERSERASRVLLGFLGSCLVLLVGSWVMFIWSDLLPPTGGRPPGVPVKDYISQGAMFTICMAVSLHFAFDAWREGRKQRALALALVAAVLVANVLYISTSRTSLVVLPVLLILFGYRRFGWKGTAAAIGAFLLLLAAAWPSASYLRLRVTSFADQIQAYHPDGPATAAGERLLYWTKSIGFIQAAPILGHGTGSIRDQFERSTAGRTGMAAEASANPHNQILAVGIQLGGVGIVLLIAMWLAHLALFGATGMVSWIGLIVVIQNIVGSQFNTHLFDFTHGWLYVVGVGVAGGTALKNTAFKRTAPVAPRDAR